MAFWRVGRKRSGIYGNIIILQDAASKRTLRRGDGTRRDRLFDDLSLCSCVRNFTAQFSTPGQFLNTMPRCRCRFFFFSITAFRKVSTLSSQRAITPGVPPSARGWFAGLSAILIHYRASQTIFLRPCQLYELHVELSVPPAKSYHAVRSRRSPKSDAVKKKKKSQNLVGI